VPQHSTRVFVERVDFVCGVGTDRARALGHSGRFHNLRHVITNLGVFDFARGRMRLLSLHPGVSLAEMEAKTGFAVEVDQVSPTRAPTEEELRLIRALDPDGKARAELKS
jgi:acyl CoA:acetate/3-ketoacid CoA transferase beta subunit